jgi:hypothetical protein
MRKEMLFLATLIVTLLHVQSSLSLNQTADTDQANAQSQNVVSLKDVFYDQGKTNSAEIGIVGQLGILLLKEDGLQPVRVDYPFKSGDRFRFKVTSNKSGCLFIFHTSPSGKLNQLWPRDNHNMEILAAQSYDIPPGPAAFRFDQEMGQELFYVAIRSDNKAPDLNVSVQRNSASKKEPQKDAVAADKPKTEISNFYIKDPFGGTGRGVLFDPGMGDSDLSLYFSAHPQDDKAGAILQFQLKHGE